MNIVQKAIKVYREEGIRRLVLKSKEYLLNKLSPKPAVANSSTPRPLWVLKYLYNLIFVIRYGLGTDVMAEDWDTLILLDACRIDDFKEINHFNGKCEYRISKGVDSPEFIEKNFVQRNLQDTVYVTANPHVRLINNDVFHEVITEPLSNWNSELQCVPPSEVTKSAIKAHQDHPNKRIIVHYMQPHDPPLGDTADTLRAELNISGPNSGSEDHGERIMQLVADGIVSKQKARKAYQETLEMALDEVNTLIHNISGKVVISSDHGEMFGERPYRFVGPLYEHYKNPKTTYLCKVPWFIVDLDNERRDICNEDKNKQNEAAFDDDQKIEKQLEALGYK
jgi:hypothetical protein